jgi:hypothetical protein
MGSVVVIPSFLLPGSLDHARHFSGEREFPETDPAQFELAQISARTPALEAPVAVPAAQLRLPRRLRNSELFVSSDLGGCGHRISFTL